MTRTARYKRKTRAVSRATVCLNTKTIIILPVQIYTAGAVREFMCFESEDILGDYKLKPDYVDASKASSNLPYIMPGAKYSYAHNSQTGFYYTLHGSKQDTVIYCGDRWCDFGTHGIGYNQWVPLTMDGYTPHFNDLSQWKLNCRNRRVDNRRRK